MEYDEILIEKYLRKWQDLSKGILRIGGADKEI